MDVKYSPSVNIIRDSEKELQYIVTPNGARVAAQIQNDFDRGFHSFNLIGSYGTGKSSFLWALEQSLQEKKKYFNTKLAKGKGKVRMLNFVGTYQSIIDSFAEQLNVKNKLAGNQEIFDALYQEYEKAGEKDGLLVIVVDELGKFLEYAAKHQPEKELYFIQQLAEFANDKNRNILFLSTLHQSFEAYSNDLNERQRKEWIKVKGRLKELTFNEPVEQLLLLASDHLSGQYEKKDKKKKEKGFAGLIKKCNVFPVNDSFAAGIEEHIYPMELFSAYALTFSLQQYGQNERSLFTFLESTDHLGINNWQEERSPCYNLANVYDYLLYNYYSFLSTKYNPHYSQWARMKSAIERADALVKKQLTDALQLIKAIGLLNLYASKGAILNDDFFQQYGEHALGISDVGSVLKELEECKIIRFSKYARSYKLIEGTDIDFDNELRKAEKTVDEVTDIVKVLNEHFSFPCITAKAISYTKGTPRNFEFRISEQPVRPIPKGTIDGYINLIFNEAYSKDKLMRFSKDTGEAVLYGSYHNVKQIKELLFEIEKTNKVLADNQEDSVARRELKNIIDHQRNLLNHYVLDNLYSDKITWIFKGKEEKVENKKAFNRLLSKICEKVYSATPVYRNELLNKHKIPGNIHLARKDYFTALANHWGERDLGFDEGKFPPEKTIYLTLLKENKIHRKANGVYELGAPQGQSTFKQVWSVCESFLESAKQERKKVTDLMDLLEKRPFKLKQGLIDFWVPTFLFIKRGDFALYEKGNFIPALNEVKLYEITRNPQHYELKTFELTDVRKKLFSKYREFLQQEKKEEPNKEAFIESVKPFLIFYKGLEEYCQKTQVLSEEAIALRTVIVNADDPEKVFFEDFPTAFKISVEELAHSDEAMLNFIQALDNAVKEIMGAYKELVNRIEGFIQEEIVGDNVPFAEYKKLLIKRFSTIKEHWLLPQQKTFVQRLNAPIDDRDSWIASISQAVLQKPLKQITDKEEHILKDRLQRTIMEMDNLREMHRQKNSGNEVIKLDMTTIEDGMRSNLVEIPKGKAKEVEKLSKEIRKQLKLKKNLNIAVLAKLLDEELKDGQD